MKKLYTITGIFLLTVFSAGMELNAQGIYQFWSGTAAGGSNNAGILFSTKYDGTGQRVKDVFDIYSPGRWPGNQQQPVVYNNKLYGTIERGGQNDNGVIYQYDPSTNDYKKLPTFLPLRQPTLLAASHFTITNSTE